MSGSHRILIVEDEPNVRLVFRTALLSNESILSTAEDGESALRWLKQEPTDLVLLDLQLPGMGGMEVLRRLRELEVDVPVVIVSAHDSVPNVVQAIRLGAVDFVPKPTTPEALRKVVAEVLSRRAGTATTTGAEPKVGPAVGRSVDALSQAKGAINRREFGEAETTLRQAIEGDAGCAEGDYLLGVLHEMRDDRQSAYVSYRAALQADPKFEPAKLHLMKYFSDRPM